MIFYLLKLFVMSKFHIPFLVLLIMCMVSCKSHPQHYVVVVSMDGFRADYCNWYNTPFLDSLGSVGVCGQMRPSYPSKTFPNHYTIATGLVPDHHGIIANSFLDRTSGRQFSLNTPETKYDAYFYGGEPLWITAQQQDVNAAAIYWPGSDVPVKGIYPSIYHKYYEKLLSSRERIQEVCRILSLPETERPHLVMCYFEEPDATGHKYGPESRETSARIEQLDSLMRELYEAIMTLPISDQIDFIITSDHGMTALSPERLVRLGDYIDLDWIETIDYSIPTMLDAHKSVVNGVTIDYSDSIIAALSQTPHVSVWRKEDVPDSLQFGSNTNVGEIIVDPELGWIIGEEFKESMGAHGFNPYNSDMQVPFIAKGPQFKKYYKKNEIFQNTSIYPLVCRLLGIKPANVDGRLEDVLDLLSVNTEN